MSSRLTRIKNGVAGKVVESATVNVCEPAMLFSADVMTVADTAGTPSEPSSDVVTTSKTVAVSGCGVAVVPLIPRVTVKLFPIRDVTNISSF